LRALILGTVVTFVVMVIYGFAIYSLAQWLPGVIPFEWVAQIALITVGVVAAIVIYFTAGPLALLIVGLYLSLVGDWDELKAAFPGQLPELKDRGTMIKDVQNTVGLALLLLAVSLLSLVPLLSLLSFAAAAFSLGKDWCWSSDELVSPAERKTTSATYAFGMGFIPALVASIPLLGPAMLPIIQVAGLLRYRSGYENHSRS